MNGRGNLPITSLLYRPQSIAVNNKGRNLAALSSRKEQPRLVLGFPLATTQCKRGATVSTSRRRSRRHAQIEASEWKRRRSPSAAFGDGVCFRDEGDTGFVFLCFLHDHRLCFNSTQHRRWAIFYFFLINPVLFFLLYKIYQTYCTLFQYDRAIILIQSVCKLSLDIKCCNVL